MVSRYIICVSLWNYRDIFKAVMTEEKLAKANVVYKINGNHFQPKTRA